jgi:hypothetical protein
MSGLEGATAATVQALTQGRPALLGTIEIEMMQLGGAFALVSVRIELNSPNKMRTIPATELESLRSTCLPSFLPDRHWRIGIGKHAGQNLNDHHYRYNAMHIAKDQKSRPK